MRTSALVFFCFSLIINNSEAKSVRTGGGGHKAPKTKGNHNSGGGQKYPTQPSNPYGGGGFQQPAPIGNPYGGGGFKQPVQPSNPYGGGGFQQPAPIGNSYGGGGFQQPGPIGANTYGGGGFKYPDPRGNQYGGGGYNTQYGGGGFKHPDPIGNHQYGSSGYKYPEHKGNLFGGGGLKYQKHKGYEYGSGLKYSHSRRMGRFGHMPLFIPVVIPMGGIGRHRHSYRNDDLQCYSCEGMDNDNCAVNPASVSSRITCPHNQYCNVLRREISFETGAIPVLFGSNINHTISKTATTIGFDEYDEGPGSETNSSHPVKELDNLKVMALKSDEGKTVTKMVISRGCKSPELLQKHLLELKNEEINGFGSVKTYSQFCLTDYCNSGDGRLQCYDCEGTGTNHSCMVRPADVARVVTCRANEYCNILRTTTREEVDNSTVLTVLISRGCKPTDFAGEDYDTDNGTSILSLSCSSDLCNFVDPTYLAPINSATSSGFERPYISVMISIYFAFLTIMMSFN